MARRVAAVRSVWFHVVVGGRFRRVSSTPPPMCFVLAFTLALLSVGCSSCGGPQAGGGGHACPEGMVHIPGGTFQMGTEFVHYNDNERPVHSVTLSPYCMAQTEVTVGGYKACQDAGACTAWHFSLWCTRDDEPDRLNRPRNCIDWVQADQFCRWRGGRLPTEAEWEFAAVGTDGRMYPWGNEAPDATRARYGGREVIGGTSDVGTHPAGRSAFGLDDMAGNVSEWVQDFDCPYPAVAQTNPLCDVNPRPNWDDRVARGAAWDANYPEALRAAERGGGSATSGSYDRGARCAADPL